MNEAARRRLLERIERSDVPEGTILAGCATPAAVLPPWLAKGVRVGVVFYQVDDPQGVLAGNQPKVTARHFEFEGTIRHVRGDAPTEEESTDIRFWVHPDEPVSSGLRTTMCPKCGVLEVGMLSASMLRGIALKKDTQ